MEEDIYLVVKSIDLLTVEEAKKLPENIRRLGRYQTWWLQSPGDSLDCVAFVGSHLGNVHSIGTYIYLDDSCVRPALLIENLDSLNLPLYTELEVFDRKWIYIGKNKALVKTYLWKGRFDPKSNDYAVSEIKKDLDIWLKEQKVKFNED